MHKVLIVVDMQNDFIDGSLGTPEAQAIVPNIINKIKNIDKNNTLVLFTKDTHGKDYLDTLEGKKLPIPHCIENTSGWSIHKDIASAINYGYLMLSTAKIKNSRIYKNTFGADDLRDFLIECKDSIKEVEFVGVCTDICVVSNALMARQALPNTIIKVDASCCAGTNKEAHKAALMIMKSCQIDVINDKKAFN